MPRLISEIKDPKLRKLAELRRDKNSQTKDDNLFTAIVWHHSPKYEGFSFWASVSAGIITELPKDHPLYDEL